MNRFIVARYIALRFAAATGALILILTFLTILIDLAEMLQVVEKTENGGVGEALLMTLLRTPKLVQVLLPFAFLFGGMFAYFQLNKRSELAVMRSAGMSVWTMLAPAIGVAFLMGLFMIFLYDPLAGRLTAQAERVRAELSGIQRSLLQVSPTGLWLRQTDDEGRRVIFHARRVQAEDERLLGVTIWRSAPDGSALDRIEAPAAVMAEGAFNLQRATLWKVDQSTPVPFTEPLPTAFTFQQLNKTAAKPETMSVWQLPDFIKLAETAGFPALDYKLHLQLLWATPVQYALLVLIAAAFSIRPMRGGGSARLAVTGVLIGFVLYVLSEIAEAFGESGSAPILVAAWTPILLGGIFGINMLVVQEEA
ncbi:MAG: LPS export ABC transporter permease LptG [Pseudomonadota bacterium]